MGKVINFYNSAVSVENSKVMQKWLNLPEEIKEKIINNVFYSVCGETTIVDYTIDVHEEWNDILLKGKCKRCGKDVARLVEL